MQHFCVMIPPAVTVHTEGAPEQTRKTAPHPAPLEDRSQGVRIWIPTLYNHWATSPRLLQYNTNTIRTIATLFMLFYYRNFPPGMNKTLSCAILSFFHLFEKSLRLSKIFQCTFSTANNVSSTQTKSKYSNRQNWTVLWKLSHKVEYFNPLNACYIGNGWMN